MISKSQASQIADGVLEAGRRDRTWRNGFTHPLPRWFRGAHLAGLSDYERHGRFDELSRRLLNRPGWMIAALSIVAGFAVPAIFFARMPFALLFASPVVLAARHYALRREFANDARAFAGRAGNTVPVESLRQERA
jgi:hypothetical protein